MRFLKVTYLIAFIFSLANTELYAQTSISKVPVTVMQKIYEEVKTPHKYGLVLVGDDHTKKVDCPTIFRKGNDWYMTYIVFDGQGYETHVAKSADLLHWKKMGAILSFSKDTSLWDANQKAGYNALEDYTWGGSYQLQKWNGRYWSTLR